MMENANQLPFRHALGKRTRDDPEALFSRKKRSYASEIASYPVGLVFTKMSCITSAIACITDLWLTRSLFRPPNLRRHPPQDPLKDPIIPGPQLRGSALMELAATSVSPATQILPRNPMAHQWMTRSPLARPQCSIFSTIVSLWAV